MAGVPRGRWARLGEWAEAMRARFSDPYERAALEAAAIDLALRQAGTNLFQLAGVTPRGALRRVVRAAAGPDGRGRAGRRAEARRGPGVGRPDLRRAPPRRGARLQGHGEPGGPRARPPRPARGADRGCPRRAVVGVAAHPARLRRARHVGGRARRAPPPARPPAPPAPAARPRARSARVR